MLQLKIFSQSKSTLFIQYYSDGSGTIDFDELKRACRGLDMGLSDNDLKKILATSDLDGDGVFTFKEFKVSILILYLYHCSIQQMVKTSQKSKKLRSGSCRKLFKEYDSDGNGFLDLDEMRLILL